VAGSKHHFVNKGFFDCRGVVNFNKQVSLGITVHSCFGINLGTSFVANLQVF